MMLLMGPLTIQHACPLAKKELVVFVEKNKSKFFAEVESN